MFSTVTETTFQNLNDIETARVDSPEGSETSVEMPADPMDSRVVLGNRQMAAVAFVIFALLALVSAMAYLAGRVMTAATITPVASVQAPEQVIVIDSRPVEAAPPAPVASAPVVMAPAANPVPSPLMKPGAVEAPKPGEVYFQVASVDRGMAEVSVEYIRKNGLAARVAPGATSDVFRVLVGPVGTSEAPVAEIEARLKGLGFTPFTKKY